MSKSVRRSSSVGRVLFVLFFAASPSAITLVSVDQEIDIGKQANAQMKKETPQLNDAEAATYVRGIGQRLARVVNGPKYPYSFVIADSRDINAFALPGGYVWIHRGVLEKATNESQVAGVLAHEIAHIARRHAASQLTTAAMTKWSLGLLGAMLGNTGGAGAAQVAAEFLASGVFLRFNRDEEREADRVGLTVLTRAGWDARGMVELFEIVRREAGRDPSSVEAFFSSHPTPKNRVAELQAVVRAHRGGTRDTRQFQTIKARLLKAPAPAQGHNR